MSGGLGLSLLSLAIATPHSGEAERVSRSGPRQDQVVLEAGVFAARPVVMSTGQVLGPSVRGGWAFGAFELGLVAQLGWANEDDRAYQVEHRELRTLAHLRWSTVVGRGELSLGMGAGVVHLHETRSRHQAERLSASGLRAEETGSTFGALLAAEAGLDLRLIDPLGVVLGAGPNLSWLADTDQGWRLGWSASLGLRVQFGGSDG